MRRSTRPRQPGPMPPEPPAAFFGAGGDGAAARCRRRRRRFRARFFGGGFFFGADFFRGRLLQARLLLRRRRRRRGPSLRGRSALRRSLRSRRTDAASWKAASDEETSSWAARQRFFVAPLGGQLGVARGLGQFVGRVGELFVAFGFVGGAEGLQSFDHAAVEVGGLLDLVGGFGFARAQGADRGVDLGADRVALGDQVRLAQGRLRFGCLHGRGRGRVAAAAAAAAGERQGGDRERPAGSGTSWRVRRHRGGDGSRANRRAVQGFRTAAQGLEPRLPRPERGVLPLHQAATGARQDTRAQPSRSGADRREIAVGVGDRVAGARDVDAVGEQPPRLGEVLGAPDAERAGDLAVLQVPDARTRPRRGRRARPPRPSPAPARRTRGSPSRRGR